MGGCGATVRPGRDVRPTSPNLRRLARRCSGAALYGHTMCEADISWPPSYKFKKGKYDEKRAPSYCDRVLWDDGAVAIETHACGHTYQHTPVTIMMTSLPLCPRLSAR